MDMGEEQCGDTEKNPQSMDLGTVGENEKNVAENYKLPNILSKCL